MRWTFHKSFDATVIKIANVTNYLMSSRGALGKETITNTLHVTANKESACDFSSHSS